MRHVDCYPLSSWKMSYGEVVLVSDAAWPKLFWHPTFPLKKKMRSVFTLSSLMLSQLTDSPLSPDWGGSLRGWYALPGSLERLDMYLKPSCCRWIALWPWNWISEIRLASHACSREQNSRQAYDSQHPLIMHAKHPLQKCWSGSSMYAYFMLALHSSLYLFLSHQRS